MAGEKKVVTPKTVLFLITGLLVFIVYLYFFVDIAEMVTIIQGANFFHYSLAAIATIVSVTLYSLTWQFFLRMLSIKSAFRKTFLFVWIGIFVDLLIPFEAISSDIVKIYLMTKNTGENAGKITASVMGKRILSMAVTLGGLVIGSAFLIVGYELPQSVLAFMLIVITYSVISIVLLCYLCFREQRTWRIINWIISLVERLFRGRWQLSNIKSRAQRMLEAFHQDIEVLGGNPKGLAKPLISSITAWFFDVSTMLLVFYAIGFNISFLEIVIVYSLIMAVQAIPLGVPAEVGLTEIIMTSLFTTLGVPSGISAAATVLTRALTVWFRIMIGYIAVQWVGIKTLRESPSTL